jgi:hypothetical protein
MAAMISATAKEAVLIANTPSFLLRKLRMDSSVRSIVDTHTSEQILLRLNDLLSVEAGSPLELAERYIWLIAFGIKSSNSQWREANIQPGTLPWGSELKALLSDEKRETFEVSGASHSSPLHVRPEVATTLGWSRQASQRQVHVAGKRS